MAVSSTPSAANAWPQHPPPSAVAAAAAAAAQHHQVNIKNRTSHNPILRLSTPISHVQNNGHALGSSPPGPGPGSGPRRPQLPPMARPHPPPHGHILHRPPMFFVREIYKNGFLKRLPHNEKKSSALAKLLKSDRYWVVFSVHDEAHPFLGKT